MRVGHYNYIYDYINSLLRKRSPFSQNIYMLVVNRYTKHRVQLKCNGTPGRTGEEVKEKLANGMGSQYSSHYLGTWCIQHYYR